MNGDIEIVRTKQFDGCVTERAFYFVCANTSYGSLSPPPVGVCGSLSPSGVLRPGR